jgi:hypothetical protein
VDETFFPFYDVDDVRRHSFCRIIIEKLLIGDFSCINAINPIKLNHFKSTPHCYQIGDSMAKAKAVKATEHHDSQHGWLAVKRDKVQEIMGLENVSRYSYQKGKTVYLECDSDLTKFYKAVEEKGIKLDIKIGKHYDSSPIRHYSPLYLSDTEKANMTQSQPQMNDHEFAAYLRKNGAIDNYQAIPNTNITEWYNGNGDVVAKALYDNANSTRQIITFK